MARSKKVSSLIEKKREISKEIENLQNECIHSKKSLRYVRENEASTTSVIRWVCDDCSKIIGYPNSQEVNKFFRE